MKFSFKDAKLQRNMSRMIKEWPNFVEQSPRTLAFDVTAAIMMNNPVFTGRSRAGWFPIFSALGGTAPTGIKQGKLLREGKRPTARQMAAAQGPQGSVSITNTPRTYRIKVTNAVEYVPEIEKRTPFITKNFNREFRAWRGELKRLARDYVRGK